MLSKMIESSRQHAAATIQDMITKMEKNHKSFIKQAFRGAQYMVEKYCEKESREIKIHFLFFPISIANTLASLCIFGLKTHK